MFYQKKCKKKKRAWEHVLVMLKERPAPSLKVSSWVNGIALRFAPVKLYNPLLEQGLIWRALFCFCAASFKSFLDNNLFQKKSSDPQATNQ